MNPSVPVIEEMGVRGERFSYAIRTNGSEVLFDNELDPFQVNNLVDDSAYESVLIGSRARLNELRSLDRMAPTVHSIVVDASRGDLLVSHQLRILATVSDASTGASEIRTPQISYDFLTQTGVGFPMRPFDGVYDSSVEEVIAELSWRELANVSPINGVMLQVRDAPGNWSDVTTISLPLGPEPKLAEESDTGDSTSDGLTLDSSPTFIGSSDPHAKVAIFFAQLDSEEFQLLGWSEADEYGKWEVTGNLSAAGEYIVYGQVASPLDSEKSTLEYLYPIKIHLLALADAALVVQGTNDEDSIRVVEKAEATVEIFLNDVSAGFVSDVLSITVFGDSGDDTIIVAGTIPSSLFGQQGYDTLRGGDGSDILNGGPNSNRMMGGLGSDRYVFADIGAADANRSNVIDIIDDPIGSPNIIDFRANLPVRTEIFEGREQYSYLSRFRNNREIRFDIATGMGQFNRLFTGTGDDLVRASVSDTLVLGAGNDKVALREPIAQSANIVLRNLSIGMSASQSEIVHTVLGVNAGTFLLRTDLGPSPTIQGNGTGVVTLVGTIAEINRVLRVGVRYSASRTFSGVVVSSIETIASTGQERDTVTFNVTAVPIIQGVKSQSQFTENGPPLLIAPAIQILDRDANTAYSTLKFWFSGIPDSDDSLMILSQSGSSLVRVVGRTVQYQNVVVGELSGIGTESSPMTVRFNENATLIAIRSVARRIVFRNLSDFPSTTPRTVSLQYIDGANASSQTARQVIQVIGVNDRPSIRSSGVLRVSANFLGFIPVAASAIVTDPEQNYSNGELVVTIRDSNSTTEKLSIRPSGSGLGQVGIVGNQVLFEGAVIGTWGGDGGAVTPLRIRWNEFATSASIQAVVRRINYRKSSTIPDALIRNIDLTLSDQFGVFSEYATRRIEFVGP